MYRKKILLMVSLGICLGPLSAQTLEEWTEQKKTQKKYLLQQIAALKVYLDYAAEGYEIAREGLDRLAEIKSGDVEIHHRFFTALGIVSPRIKNYLGIAAIILYEARMARQWGRVLAALASGAFTEEEKRYGQSVLDAVVAEWEKLLEELLLLTTDGSLQLTDDERLAQVNKLEQQIRDLYTFCASFCSDIKLLAEQREAEKRELEYAGRINGIK